MRLKVVKKHNNSKSCFVCGIENEAGLDVSFYELENKDLVGIYNASKKHVSYPDRLHGGVTASLLDETIGRAINCFEPEVFGVTVDLKIRYKKPVNLENEIKVIGRITRNTSRIFEGEGCVLLPDGTVCALGKARYMKMDITNITDETNFKDEWFLLDDNNYTEIEVPDNIDYEFN